MAPQKIASVVFLIVMLNIGICSARDLLGHSTEQDSVPSSGGQLGGGAGAGVGGIGYGSGGARYGSGGEPTTGYDGGEGGSSGGIGYQGVGYGDGEGSGSEYGVKELPVVDMVRVETVAVAVAVLVVVEEAVSLVVEMARVVAEGGQVVATVQVMMKVEEHMAVELAEVMVLKGRVLV